MSEFQLSAVDTEADLDSRIVLPYLAAIGVQPDQIRAQRTFSLRLGRNMVHNVDSGGIRTGRLDYLIVRADGTPLFVVEMKRPSEALTEDDRDQGISYARLVDPIAPLVLVTNGKDSELYDTVTRHQIANPQSASLIAGEGRLTDDESLRIRAEALEYFIGYSGERLAAFTRAQRTSRMSSLRGDTETLSRKYETKLYVTRSKVRDNIKRFLGSDQLAFVLGGSSGYGKTNEMCALAEELGETHLTLFFNGADIATDLSRLLAEEFNWHFSEILPVQHICRRLARLADVTGHPALIVIDAIDEAPAALFARELSNFVRELGDFGGRLRLVASVKLTEWGRFSQVRGIPSALQERTFVVPDLPALNTKKGDKDAQLLPQLSGVLDIFTPGERDAAVTAYVSAFGLPTTWSPDLLELARDPFMLRVVAEVAASTNAFPKDSGDLALVRRYIDEKIRRTSNPDRARLELVEVARTLASSILNSPSTRTSESSIDERSVRAIARLTATDAVAAELVEFGVLIRSTDNDGNYYLAFAYDRVRDYMVAMHGLRLSAASRGEFREITTCCLNSEAGSSALQWFLQHATDDQWAGFIDAASQRVEQVLTVYEALLANLQPAISQYVDPQSTGQLGIGYGATRSGWFGLAFFVRKPESHPRVIFDPWLASMFDDGDGTLLKRREVGNRRVSRGFWFLRKPKEYAAQHFKKELERLIKEGGLVESDATLSIERATALFVKSGKRFGRMIRKRSLPNRFADLFVHSEIYPLDLRTLYEAVQIELAIESYRSAHMKKLTRAEIARQSHANVASKSVTVVGNFTNEMVEEFRRRAETEVRAGIDFIDPSSRDNELSLLASTLRELLKRRDVLEKGLIPAPDISADDIDSGAHNFEDGYTDVGLAHLLTTVFDHGLNSFERVIGDSFSPRLREIFPRPGMPIGIVCYRKAINEGYSTQFRASVNIGEIEQLEGDLLKGRKAVAFTVGPSVRTDNARTASAWRWDTMVTTPEGTAIVKVRHLTSLQHALFPYDTPPFVRRGTRSSADHAPIRAQVYAYAKDGVKDLSISDLISVAGATQ